MTIETLYFALPFKRTMDGHFTALEARSCTSSEHAAAEASALSSQSCGAVAISRSIDPASGCANDAQIIYSVGDLPKLDYLLG